MRDEILEKALPTDQSPIPRYQILDADGSVLHDNVEVRLVNNVQQPGTPYSADAVLQDAVANSMGLSNSATPNDAFKKLASSRVVTLNYSNSGTQHFLTGLLGLTGTISCVFTPTAPYKEGDTLLVEGTQYTIQLSNGDKADAGLFVAGATVAIVVDTAGKKVNFKSAGGVKLPAGTFVIVKTYVSKYNVSEQFVVPIDGTYRITVVGKGGDGASHDNFDEGNGGGGGAWARSLLKLNKSESVQVTCNNSISSFGSYLSATSGKNGRGTVSSQSVSLGGTAVGGNEQNNNGSSSSTTGSGGHPNNYGNSPFLSTAYQFSGSDERNGYTPASTEFFNCFGLGGGGGGRTSPSDGTTYGGKGAPGSVIIELLLKGVNDT